MTEDPFMTEPEKPEDPREEFPECMTVGELRRLLAPYRDDQIVSIAIGPNQAPEDIWDLHAVEDLPSYGPLLCPQQDQNNPTPDRSIGGPLLIPGEA